MSSDEPNKSTDKILRSAGRMGFGTLLSRVGGLIREQVFAYFFGASLAADAFQIAFRIPNLLRDLFAEGAMSAALVPTFTEVRKIHGDLRAWLLAKRVFISLLVLAGTLALVGAYFSESMVHLYAQKFKEIPGKFELTVTLTRQMMPFFPLVVLAAAFMAILNACGVFFIPAFSSALFNLVSTAVGAGLATLFGVWDCGYHPIEGMAIGVVVGGIVQAFSQWPSLRQVGFRKVNDQECNVTSAYWKDPYLKKMLGLMVPGTIGLAATQLNILVNSIFATQLGPGVVSWLNYAFRLMQFPIGIFGVSLANATLTEVSKQKAEALIDQIGPTVERSMRNVFALNFPAAFGLAFLAQPLVGLLFQYGRFTESDTRSTALVLQVYAVGLVAYSGVKILVPLFYVFNKVRVAVVSSFLVVALNAVLNYLFAPRIGFPGLALATSLAVLLNFGYLLLVFRKIVESAGGRFSLSKILSGAATHFCVGLAMVVLGAGMAYGGIGPVLRLINGDMVLFSVGNLPEILHGGMFMKAPLEGFSWRFIWLFSNLFFCVFLWILICKILKLEESLAIFRIFLSKLRQWLS